MSKKDEEMVKENIEEKKADKEKTKPSWVKMKPAELEKIVLELHKSGKTPAQIGLELRDKHGVPSAKSLGKKVTQILKEKELEYETEDKVVEKKIDTLKNHLKNNKHDYPASRALAKSLWALRRAQR